MYFLSLSLFYSLTRVIQGGMCQSGVLISILYVILLHGSTVCDLQHNLLTFLLLNFYAFQLFTTIFLRMFYLQSHQAILSWSATSGVSLYSQQHCPSVSHVSCLHQLLALFSSDISTSLMEKKHYHLVILKTNFQ